mmetsp:Transcript_2378/g.4108  ORF Transcript_2378/g.4108 Transcript_2378/m.4108 type:complete len:95 (+) Transcript_2378:2147-2431(+)
MKVRERFSGDQPKKTVGMRTVLQLHRTFFNIHEGLVIAQTSLCRGLRQRDIPRINPLSIFSGFLINYLFLVFIGLFLRDGWSEGLGHLSSRKVG